MARLILATTILLLAIAVPLTARPLFSPGPIPDTSDSSLIWLINTFLSPVPPSEAAVLPACPTLPETAINCSAPLTTQLTLPRPALFATLDRSRALYRALTARINAILQNRLLPWPVKALQLTPLGEGRCELTKWIATLEAAERWMTACLKA